MAVAISLLFGFFVMLLWNQLMPDIFGLKPITYGQGAGLVILCRLLFGTPGRHPTGHGKKDIPANPVEEKSSANETQNG
ncbi:hypothetical protein [Heliomicrobium gestii]|uniref:hypothetical protein n=1 Tax=Heliomicrobium gestii TaxID=2699 RepID=UPI001F3A9C9B|nr:hypothetical protein [Heliomicrobium gestii]